MMRMFGYTQPSSGKINGHRGGTSYLPRCSRSTASDAQEAESIDFKRRHTSPSTFRSRPQYHCSCQEEERILQNRHPRKREHFRNASRYAPKYLGENSSRCNNCNQALPPVTPNSNNRRCTFCPHCGAQAQYFVIIMLTTATRTWYRSG